ncbi:hypothetical protein HOY80DRAFT_966894 [Tuber brumale]|nr:hypothetical protein HOY80DRAFT_966894 [Tuber brumale]
MIPRTTWNPNNYWSRLGLLFFSSQALPVVRSGNYLRHEYDTISYCHSTVSTGGHCEQGQRIYHQSRVTKKPLVTDPGSPSA